MVIPIFPAGSFDVLRVSMPTATYGMMVNLVLKTTEKSWFRLAIVPVSKTLPSPSILST